MPRSEVAKYAAASIQMQLGRGPGGLILLHSIQGEQRLWLSPDGILLVTRAGRLTQTGGLQRNLDGTTFETSDPVDGGLLSADGARCRRLLRYHERDAEQAVQIEAISKFENVGPKTLEILGVPTPTIHVREHVHVREVVWRHSNDYWADAKTGMVWKSRQHIFPSYPALTLTTLRPVAS